MNQMYDVSKYSDAELYRILEVNANVSDRELEAKILHYVYKYKNMGNESGDMLAGFFSEIYERFFEMSNDEEEADEEEDEVPLKEGFTVSGNMSSGTSGKYSTWNNATGVTEKGNGKYNNQPQLVPTYGNVVVNGQRNYSDVQRANLGNITSSKINASVYQDTSNLMKTQSTGAVENKMMGYQANVPTTPNDISITKQVDYSKDNLNPLLKQTIKRIISIDSQYRQNKQTASTSFTFNLSEPLRDVVSLKLYSVQIPFTWYIVNSSFGGNFLYIKGNTAGIDNGNHDYKFEITPGNYQPQELVDAINTTIKNVSAMNTDVSFGQTRLTYNSNRVTCTVNVDMTNIYNQSNFFLHFPNWTNERTQSLASYLGFNRNATANQPLDLMTNVIYSNNQTIKDRDMVTITNDNSYITFICCSGNVYDPNAITLRYNIVLPVKTTTRKYIVDSINEQIVNRNILNHSNSSFSLVTDSVTKNTYYKCQLNPSGTIFNINSKFILLPYDTNVWIGKNSVFKFDNSFNNSFIVNSSKQNIQDTDPVTITNDNSNITFVSYVGSSYQSSTKIDSYSIQLERSITTRKDVITAIHTKMANSNFLDTLNSSFSLVNDSTYDASYYQFKIQFDRKHTTNKDKLNYAILFPDDTNLWVGNTSIFKFDASINECNHLTTTVPSLQTNYLFDPNSTINIQLQCINPLFDSEKNTLIIDCSNGSNVNGYLLHELVDYLNGQIRHVSLTKSIFPGSNDLCSSLNNQKTRFYPNYPETDGSLNMDIEIMRVYTNKHYLAKTTYPNLTPSGEYINTFGCPYNGYVDLSNQFVSTSIFVFNMSIDNPTYTFSQDFNNLYLIPKFDNGYSDSYKDSFDIANYGNKDCSFNVTFSTGNLVGVNSVSKLFEYITQTIMDFSYNGHYIFRGSIFTVLDSGAISKTFKSIIDLRVNVPLTQNDYRLVFYDSLSNNVDDRNFWVSKLRVNSSYLLSNYKDTANYIHDVSYSNGLVSYRTVLNVSDVSSNNLIQLFDGCNNYFYVNSYKVDGLVGSDAEYIKVAIDASNVENGGTYYGYNELMDNINAKLNENKITHGMTLQYSYENDFDFYHTTKPVYVKIRVNVNKIYLTNDYRLVFYDPFSFVNCYTGATSTRGTSIQNATWDTTIGWLLGFRSSIIYYLSDYTVANSNITTMESDTCISMNIYNYFLIMLDDYTQNHLNDGLVTITMQETKIDAPTNLDYVCDPITGTQTIVGNGITAAQTYAANQKLLSQKLIAAKSYSNGPFVKDIFGLIPMKTSGFTPGSVYVEFGGTLQNQERTYFGPVNIHRMTIKLLTDRGDLVDLNGANWSFSFVCETLYKSKT